EARGAQGRGGSRTCCKVNEQVMPAELRLVTANVNSVLVTDLIAAETPLETALMLLAVLPEPVTRVISAVGAVPLVSKMKPLGVLRMMVPTPTLPLATSV